MRPWYLLYSHLSAKTCTFKLCLFFDLAFFPFGHYSEGYEVCLQGPPCPRWHVGVCLPVPDPQQELLCPSRCSGQRGIVLPTSSSCPAATSRFIPTGDAARKAGCCLSVHKKVLGNRAGISPVWAEDEEARNLLCCPHSPQTFLGQL